MIINVISSGIAYLQTQQQKDGSFLSLSSPNPLSFQKALTFHSVFSTALILSCLNTLEETAVLRRIKRKAASFLLTQKSKHWSFNYWVRGSSEAKVMPYPDDLDDTFCTLSALFQYDPKLIDGAAMAKAVELLTMLEEEEGGPYRTWIVPENVDPIWKDVDVVVNSNIAYFLSLQEIALPSLTTFIESRIAEGSLISPYYPTVFPLLYFISRFYHGDKISKLTDMILAKRERKGNWGNSLEGALSISTLLNFKIVVDTVEKNVLHLMHTQKSGFWEPSGFYIDPARKGSIYYAGSSSLTTAFCLEALGKYVKALKTQSIKTTKRDAESKHIQNQVVLQVQQRFSRLTRELNNQAESILTGVLKMNAKNQITLLPYFFKTALGKNGTLLSDKLLISLGAANTYGWIAYTIYDNFLDEEGDPRTLPIANIALRELTTIFHKALPYDLKFHKLSERIMDEIDTANNWEVTHCRIKINNESIDLQNLKLPNFGNYEILAQKSLGHGLGPLTILLFLGYKKDSLEVKNLLAFFRHYLIARQLNDDAHDWEQDFKIGHITPVNASLLKKLRTKLNPEEARLSFSVIIPKLQELFWYEVVVEVCQKIQKHVRLARKYLNSLSIVMYPNAFEELLASLEHSAKEALEEHGDTIAFIDSYKNRTL